MYAVIFCKSVNQCYLQFLYVLLFFYIDNVHIVTLIAEKDIAYNFCVMSVYTSGYDKDVSVISIVVILQQTHSPFCNVVELSTVDV